MSDHSHSDEALRKVGRNVVYFQKLEGLIKALVSAPNYSGSIEEIQAQRKKHLDSLDRKSLGMVVSALFETTYPENPSQPSRNENDTPEYQITLQIAGGDREQLIRDIETLVNERNELIHHRLIGFDPTSQKDCVTLVDFLDDQHERLVPIFNQMSSIFESVKELRIALAKHLDSELSKNEKGSLDVE